MTSAELLNDDLNRRPETLLRFGKRRRLPVIYQTENAECGLVCLAMIAGYYGFETDLSSLRRRFPISSYGMHLKHLVDLAGRMELSARALRVDTDELTQLQLPCVLHWGINHFVVLHKIKNNKYVIHDPAFGERKIGRDELENQFTGVLLEISPTHAFCKGEDKQHLKLSSFWTEIVGLKRSLGHIIVLSLMLQVLALVSPFYMQIVVDKVVSRGDVYLLWSIAAGFSLLLLVQLAVNALREMVILYLSSRLNIQMAANLFYHLMRLTMDYFSKRHMGDIVSRFGSLGQVRHLLTTGVVSALIDGLMTVITLTAMFFYSVKLTLIVMVVIVIYAALRVALYRPFKQLGEESLIASARENSHFMESVRAIQAIKIFQRENDRQNQWQSRLAEVINKNIRVARWGIAYSTMNGFLFGAENILVICLAANSVMDGNLSLGMFYAFMSYKTSFSNSIERLISQAVEFKMLEIHLDRLSDIAFADTEKVNEHQIMLKQADAPDFQQVKNQAAPIVGKIEVKNLSYRYEGCDQETFKNVSFCINPGETVAITGPSGCGKTTLLKCLMGLIAPTSGEIFIDDKPLKSLSCYRSQIAGVMQDDQLVSGDIGENIAFFSANIDWGLVQKSAEIACIRNEILRLPMQFNSLVGDMGTSLSGGQKQRVLLARALYREPRILFMDEATSHLDIENESLVNSQVNSLAITRVLVAHRPETVRSAGRQINMADFS